MRLEQSRRRANGTSAGKDTFWVLRTPWVLRVHFGRAGQLWEPDLAPELELFSAAGAKACREVATSAFWGGDKKPLS